jgi:hypothetical protein
MKQTTIAAIALATSLALSSSAGAAPIFGVSDDRGKYADDGGAWFFDELSLLGLQANKMTVNWDPSRPDVIVERPFLERSVPLAIERGLHVSFGIHIGKARAITGSPRAIDSFVAWLQKLARTYPAVTEYVIGNEPNLTRFWQPQFDRRGRNVSGIAFAAFLARSYDALKAVNPNITVVGVGLSPRGNDMPRAKSNISTSPVKFIRSLGIGYGLMARNKPIMDVFGFHPYPARDRDPLHRGYRWPNAGVANLDRIKQAVWDAFHDTAQPTFLEGLPEPPAPPEPPSAPEPPPPPTGPPPVLPPLPVDLPVPPLPVAPAAEPPVRVSGPGEGDPGEPGAPRPGDPLPEPEHAPPLTFKLDEVGWQVAIPATSRRAYHGRENVRPTNERTQARIYGELVRRMSCDASVSELLFFGLVDEANLDRWQAGVVRADRTRRPAWGAVRSALDDVANGCPGRLRAWHHTEKVVGAAVSYSRGRVVVKAEEDATATIAGRRYKVRAYRPLRVPVRGRPVVELTAAMNSERVSVFR